MQPELTERQAAILNLIRDRWRENCSPTYREIQKEFGLKYINGVASHLQALGKKGYIQLRKHGTRSIRPTGEPSYAELRDLVERLADGQSVKDLRTGAKELLTENPMDN